MTISDPVPVEPQPGQPLPPTPGESPTSPMPATPGPDPTSPLPSEDDEGEELSVIDEPAGTATNEGTVWPAVRGGN